MAFPATESTFSIPFRYLWSTNFAGDLDALNERPSGLARFVGDEKNRILKVLSESSINQFTQESGRHLWPLILFGPSGTGKTSLALSLISDLANSPVKTDSDSPQPAKQDPTRVAAEKPIVITALDFDRRFRAALATDSVADFRRRLTKSRGLVIDDVHRLTEKLATQAELLLLIDQRGLRNGPLILTFDRDPLLCDGFLPQLISRCSGGLNLPVQAPGADAREIIIRDLADIHRLNLTDDALKMLVDRLNVTVPKIVHFFAQLQTAAVAETNKLKKSQSSESASSTALTINTAFITRMFHRTDTDLRKLAKIIIKQVAAEFGIKISELRSDSRKQSIVAARSVAIYLIRSLLGTSFGKIGGLFGNRDHSTIMHAYRKTENRIKESPADSTESHADDPHHALKLAVIELEQRLANLFASEVHFH